MDDKIKVSDYLADYLASIGVEYVHLIFGGGAMTIQDSLCKHPKIKYIAYHSEAGASYAAFGYSKYTNRINVVAPTTGIATINACSGLISAYQDSTPVLFISGDVPIKQTSYYQKKYKNINLRQLGIQEFNTIDTVKSMTKYSVFLEKAEDIAYEIEKCVYECLNGRPGPCWINIPSDIAASLINPNELVHFKPNETSTQQFGEDDLLKENIELIKKDLVFFQRPLVLAGNGVHCSNTRPQLKQFIEKYQLPLVATFLGVDFVNYDNPLNIGRIGIKGNRAANFALQNCNYLLILGASLTIPHVGYLLDKFAPKAKKVAIDVDNEVHKKDTIKLDNIINCNLKDFFNYVNK